MTDHKPKSSERVSAFVALASLAGAVVVLVIGSIINVGAIVMILVGLILAIIGAWDSLTRRGVIRFVAAALVLVGLGLVAGGFAWADLSVGRIVSVVALALLSVGAARFALGKDRSEVAIDDRLTPRCRPGESSGVDHELEVRRWEGREVSPCRRVQKPRNRADCPAAGGRLTTTRRGRGRPRRRCPRDGGGRRLPGTRRFGRRPSRSSLRGGSGRHQKSLRT